VRFDERYLRPTDVDSLIDDATNQLNLEPNEPDSKAGWTQYRGLATPMCIGAEFR
jgi:hypothetical protein